eukprot:8547828-Pyramimonas_sp.AAC.1
MRSGGCAPLDGAPRILKVEILGGPSGADVAHAPHDVERVAGLELNLSAHQRPHRPQLRRELYQVLRE